MSQFNASQVAEGYANGRPAAMAAATDRAAFIRRTYAHLAGALLAFAGLEALIFTLVPEETIHSFTQTLTGGWMWLLVLGAFMGVSMLARMWASSDTSKGIQYAGLALYVVAQAIIFVPLLYIVAILTGQGWGLIYQAGLVTAAMFCALSLIVFLTRADFSFLRGILIIAGFAALAVIAGGILFNLSIFGLIFTSLMIALACGYILYDTSNVLHHYRTDQHVAASLALFASVALLLWYVIRLLSILNRN